MSELIKMKKERVVDIVLILLSIGLFISYFYTGFLALPFVAGLFIGERFINPLIFKNNGE
jgi:accessory gene regulator protein AgrB